MNLPDAPKWLYNEFQHAGVDYADVEVAMDGSLTLVEAHKHAEEVHERIERECPLVKHAAVHVNPV